MADSTDLIAKEMSTAKAKWTERVISIGHTTFPSLLLKAQADLKLTPELFNVLMQLAGMWWYADKEPYVSKTTLAIRMGKSPRQIQRYLTSLEKLGYVKRIERFRGHGIKGQTANGYSLKGLVRNLKILEPAFRNTKGNNKIRYEDKASS